MPPAFALSQDQTLKFIPFKTRLAKKAKLRFKQNEEPKLTYSQRTSRKPDARQFKAYLYAFKRNTPETLPIMTIRYISSSKAQTKTRSPSTSHHQNLHPSNRTSPRRSPHKNRKRHQRIPSQPIQLSNSNLEAPTANQLKRHRFRYLKAADAQSVERLLQPTSPHCQQAVTQANPWISPKHRKKAAAF